MKKLYIGFIPICLGYIIYILIATPPSSGYEVSIYNTYPILFWVVFSLYSLVNIAIILISKNQRYIYLALSCIFVSTIILILLPCQREYFCVDGGDSMTHLTYIENIINYSKFGLYPSNIDPYPIPHILAVGLHYLGVRLEATIQILPSLYFAWFIAFMFLLARHFTSNIKLISIILLLCMLPILKINLFYPSLFFIFLLPSLFYFVIKKWWIPACIMALILPISHPASMLLFVILILVTGIIMYAQGYRLEYRNYAPFIVCVIILLVAWGLWLFVLKPQFSGFIDSVITTATSGVSQYRETAAGLSMAQLNFVDIITLYIKRYGIMHGIFGLGLISSVVIMIRWWRGKINKRNYAITISIIYLLSFGLYVASWFIPEYVILGRIYSYTLFLAIALTALLIKDIIIRWKTAVLFVVAIFFLINILACFTLYDSPFSKKPSQQITYAELKATKWLINNKVHGLPVYDLLHQQKRIATYLLGYYQNNKNISDLDFRGLPFHFGYDKGTRLGDIMGEDCYLLTNQKNIEISTKIYPEYANIWTYTPEDYDKLAMDDSLTLLYNKNDIRIYYIDGE